MISKHTVKKQQMRRPARGARLFLQVSTRVLDGPLAGDFHRCHPGFTRASDPARPAA